MHGIIRVLSFGLALCLGAATAQARPVVAVLAQNGGTEITDFLVPYGVIARSGAADVVAVSLDEGPVDFMNGVEARADETLASFDRAHPRGADYVIIPAFHDAANPVTRAWLRAQAAKGAVLVSICDGAMVLAGTGLLDGRKATGHFYSLDARRKDFPKVQWMTNRRFVQDGPFISSSGVSASLPASLYVVERIAGREKALEAARAVGATGYSAAHDSDAFRLGMRDYWVAAKSWLLGWPRDAYALRVENGVDEVGFAFAADMLPRTFRAKVDVVTSAAEVTTRHGLHLLRTEKPEDVPSRAVTVRIGGAADGDGLTVGEGARAPEDMAAYLLRRYGAEMARFVTVQMEYPVKAAEKRASISPPLM